MQPATVSAVAGTLLCAIATSPACSLAATVSAKDPQDNPRTESFPTPQQYDYTVDRLKRMPLAERIIQ